MNDKPKFRPDLQISAYHIGEGQSRVVLKDPVTEKFYYLSKYELQLLQALDGTVTLEEALERLRGSGRYYSPEDARYIVSKAAQMGLILGTRFGTARHQLNLKERAVEAQKARRLPSIYFLFIPLLNPDRFLDKTLWLARVVGNRITAAMTALMFPGALYLLVLGAPRIHREFLYFFNWENLLYLWIAIAAVKLFHEFAHAYSAKSYGLRVPQMGIAFLIFFPCLYCNTTDAWSLAERRQRMAISAAGILVEGALAILSTYVWYFSKPGILNSLAFYFMAVSFISSLLFNGNPLLRFDGYFVLMDWLRIPNLSTRSFGYIKYLVLNRVFGITLVSNPATEERETVIFTMYGISALIYRVFLYTAIILGVYFRFDKTLGIVLAILAFGVFVIRPIARGIRSLSSQKEEIHPRPLGALVLVLILAVVMFPLFVSVSRNSVYPCYVTSARIQKLTVPRHTSVEKVFIQEGSVVDSGELLFTLDASELRLALTKKELERRIVQTERDMLIADHEKSGWAETKTIELAQLDAHVQRIKDEVALATEGIRAPFDGVVSHFDPRMQQGYRPGEGYVVGELECRQSCVVHALIPEEDVGEIKVLQRARVWFPIERGLLLQGLVTGLKPYSEKDMRDSPFSSRVGGEVAIEANEEGERETPLEPRYLCIVEVAGGAAEVPLGMTGRFVIDRPPMSIAQSIMNGIISTFNRESLF